MNSTTPPLSFTPESPVTKLGNPSPPFHNHVLGTIYPFLKNILLVSYCTADGRSQPPEPAPKDTRRHLRLMERSSSPAGGTLCPLHRPPPSLTRGGGAQGTSLVPARVERAGYLILGWWWSLGKNHFGGKTVYSRIREILRSSEEYFRVAATPEYGC